MDSATLSLLRESVVSFLNMSDPSQQCPSVWQKITTPHRVCGRRSTLSPSCEELNYTTGSEQYDQVCGRRSTLSPRCEGLNYTTGSEQYDQVCGEGPPFLLAVRGSLTPLVVSSMARCVGGSLATN